MEAKRRNQRVTCKSIVLNYLLNSIDNYSFSTSQISDNVKRKALDYGLSYSYADIERRFRELKNEMIESGKFLFITVESKNNETRWILKRNTGQAELFN